MNTTLTLTDFAALSPLLILLGVALVLILLESFSEINAKKYSFPLTLVGLLVALHAGFYYPDSESPLLTPWLRFDSLAHFFTVFFIGIGLASTLLSAAFFKRFEANRGEYYFLLITSVIGLILIGSAADFLTLFIGLETLSISLYIWCGYMKKWTISQESSLKYFLMGSLGASFLIYGIALIYGAVGTTNLSLLLPAYKTLQSTQEMTLFLSGAAFITVGLAFKAAIVPFHTWAPDVYCGAPTPVTAFMSVGTKAGAFAAFILVFMKALPQFNPIWNEGISLLAYPSLIYANYVALKQLQLRRFFAYSGISHAGFLLIPLAAGTSEAYTAILFYLVIYAIATLGCFAVLSFLDQRNEGVVLDDLKGLFYKSPWLAGIFTVCLLTLAGVPPTAGFFAKFFVFMVAFQAGYYGLVVVGLLTTILSVYYYLRFVSVMFTKRGDEEQAITYTWQSSLVGALALVSILILSIYPVILMNLHF